MIPQIAWAALTVFIFCMVSLGVGPETPGAVWVILILAAVMAVVCLCAFWHMSARPSKPVSPYMAREPQKVDPLNDMTRPDNWKAEL